MTHRSEDEMKKNWTEINKTEKEIAEIKNKKHFFRFKLRELYLTMMKNPKEAIGNDKSLFALMRSLKEIKEEVKKNILKY